MKVWFLTSFNLWKCASSPSVKNLLIFNVHATNSYKHTKLELNLFSWPVKPTCSENYKDPSWIGCLTVTVNQGYYLSIY